MNSMSFGESVFVAGFNQKTAKEDIIIKGKYGVPPRYLRGKTLEGSRSHLTKAEGHPLTGGAEQPRPTCQPASYGGLPQPLRMHLGRCLSQFDPRAHVGPSGLYNPAPASPPGITLVIKSFEMIETLISSKLLLLHSIAS